ncbi:MAG: MaoC family dehydratase [Actinobacteria bacterium]|nr:MAG: MaoC family dehydratase [Actinomycetota bacterium]
MNQIRFDDIDALNAAAFDEFGPWGPPVKVTQDMVDAFAELTGDHQWIHADVERAKRDSPFGGTIAHGFLTLSLLPAMGAQTVRITGQSSAVNYGAEKLRFLAPVPIPSEVHARGRLVRAEARPKGTLVTTEADVSVVDADKPSLLYTMQVLYLP